MYVTFNQLILEKQAFFENTLFTLPRQPIKLCESDKNLITVENYSINISVKLKCQVSASSPIWFLRRRFLNIFTKIDPFCRLDNQSNSPIWTKVV